jgi:hypothetical protein
MSLLRTETSPSSIEAQFAKNAAARAAAEQAALSDFIAKVATPLADTMIAASAQAAREGKVCYHAEVEDLKTATHVVEVLRNKGFTSAAVTDANTGHGVYIGSQRMNKY